MGSIIATDGLKTVGGALGPDSLSARTQTGLFDHNLYSVLLLRSSRPASTSIAMSMSMLKA